MFVLLLALLTTSPPDPFPVTPDPSPVEVEIQASPYQWRYWSADPDRHYLYRAGVQVGAYCHRTKKYRAYDATKNTWGTPSDYLPHTPVPARGSPVNPFGAEAMLKGVTPAGALPFMGGTIAPPVADRSTGFLGMSAAGTSTLVRLGTRGGIGDGCRG